MQGLENPRQNRPPAWFPWFPFSRSLPSPILRRHKSTGLVWWNPPTVKRPGKRAHNGAAWTKPAIAHWTSRPNTSRLRPWSMAGRSSEKNAVLFVKNKNKPPTKKDKPWFIIGHLKHEVFHGLLLGLICIWLGESFWACHISFVGGLEAVFYATFLWSTSIPARPVADSSSRCSCNLSTWKTGDARSHWAMAKATLGPLWDPSGLPADDPRWSRPWFCCWKMAEILRFRSPEMGLAKVPATPHLDLWTFGTTSSARHYKTRASHEIGRGTPDRALSLVTSKGTRRSNRAIQEDSKTWRRHRKSRRRWLDLWPGFSLLLPPRWRSCRGRDCHSRESEEFGFRIMMILYL